MSVQQFFLRSMQAETGTTCCLPNGKRQVPVSKKKLRCVGGEEG